MGLSLKKKQIYSEPSIDILGGLALFEDLKEVDGALEVLAEKLKFTTLEMGDVVLEEGKMAKNLFILVSGELSVHKKTPDQDSYKVAVVPQGTVATIGEGSLVSNETRSATVICDTRCEFLVLSREKFLEFSNTHPIWAVPIYRKIAGILAKRVKKLNTDVTLLHAALTKEIRED